MPPFVKGQTRTWTDEQDELIRQMAADLKSTGETLRVLCEIRPGVTRNAIIGRAHRIGVVFNSYAGCAKRNRPVKPPRPPKSLNPPAYATLKADKSLSVPPLPGGMISGHYPLVPVRTAKWGSSSGLDGLTFLELEEGSCRWPARLDAGGVIELYCGSPTEGAYCKTHMAMALRPADRIYVNQRIR